MIEGLLIFITRLTTGAAVYTHSFSFDPPAQRIYYANHSSHMDALLLWTLIPKSQRTRVRPAAAQDYWWKSATRRYIAERIFHAVPVARTREGNENPLQHIETALEQGDSLIFFPEGTRGDGKAIQPFKSGLYRLACRYPSVEFVPVYVDNLNRVLPKGEFLPVPVICSVHFGKPFTIDTDEPKESFLARAQSNLLCLVKP